MTNSEQALREIAEKWGFSQYKTDEGFLIDNDRTKQCLSDLNALLRQELIKYDKWCESQSTASLILLSTEDLVDKYLNEQQ